MFEDLMNKYVEVECIKCGKKINIPTDKYEESKISMKKPEYYCGKCAEKLILSGEF